jgi:Glycosyl hydrolases family 16
MRRTILVCRRERDGSSLMVLALRTLIGAATVLFAVLPAACATDRSQAHPPGNAMPVGDIAGWRQVFTDDFTSTVDLGRFSGCRPSPTLAKSNCGGVPASVRAKWWVYPDGWRDSGTGTYYPSQVLSINHGDLDYGIHTTSINGKQTHLVAATLPKIQGAGANGGHVSGRFVIRFRASALPGYHLAFLLWPDSNNWPHDGEIDFPEGNLDGHILAFMHHRGAVRGDQQDVYRTNATFTSWHTAAIDWRRTYCRFILDGKVVGTSTAHIPDRPLHWVLQVNALGGGLPGHEPAATTVGHVQIAWVAAYQPR